MNIIQQFLELLNPKPLATQDDFKNELNINGLGSNSFFIRGASLADVNGIIGRVFIQVSDKEGFQRWINPVKIKVNPDSILKTPVTLSELVVDKKTTLEADVMKCVNINFSENELLEVRIIDNAKGQVDDISDEWEKAGNAWLESNEQKIIDQYPNFIAAYVVMGAVQRYFTIKKYKKLEGTAKGDGFGVNVGGNYYTSTSQYTLSIVYELDITPIIPEKTPSPAKSPKEIISFNSEVKYKEMKTGNVKSHSYESIDVLEDLPPVRLLQHSKIDPKSVKLISKLFNNTEHLFD